MARKYLSEIRAEVRQFLKDEFVSSSVDFTWGAEELDRHIEKVVGEISRVDPTIVTEVKLTYDGSKILDISGISDLMWISKCEYPIGNDPRTFKNISWVDSETIEIDTSLSPEAGESGTLTGTVTFTSGSTAVTGSGTDFDGELAENYHIRKSGGTRWYRVQSVTDDTNLVLAEPVKAEDTGADTEDSTPYYNDEVAYLFCAKPHTLSDTKSTLKPQQELLLVEGVLAYAAISKAREYINTQNISNRALSEMLTWGQNKLILYKQELASLASSGTHKEYARG
jgi:hypothetical protein